jgi:hypothetical protein
LNTNYVFPSAQVGEYRNAMLYAAGPSSYAASGDPVYNPGSGEYINFPSDCSTLSGNYRVRFTPLATGLNQSRAGGGVGGPSVSGWIAIWEYAGTSDNPISASDTPIGQGALSAAATQSTFTANGVLTVATTTPPPVNSFVLLSNGTSGAGIVFNGSIGQVVSVVQGVSYTINFGAMKSLNYTVATDTLKYQVLQIGASNPVALGTSVAVTSVAVASNVLTVVCAGLVPPGIIGVLQGLAAGEVPQGAIVQVLPGATATGFTANIIAANLGATTGETATFTPLVTNGNAPVTTAAASTITGSTVAATAAISTAAGKITVLPVAQDWTMGNLFIVQGLTHGAALNGGIFSVLATGLTGSNVAANGFIATAVTTGTADLGSASLLVAGDPPNGERVAIGTNLSAEQIQFAALVSSL